MNRKSLNLLASYCANCYQEAFLSEKIKRMQVQLENLRVNQEKRINYLNIEHEQAFELFQKVCPDEASELQLKYDFKECKIKHSNQSDSSSQQE